MGSSYNNNSYNYTITIIIAVPSSCSVSALVSSPRYLFSLYELKVPTYPFRPAQVGR